MTDRERNTPEPPEPEPEAPATDMEEPGQQRADDGSPEDIKGDDFDPSSAQTFANIKPE